MLPNNVSGDGRVYASTLKKVLNFFGTYINDNVDEKLDQLGDGAAANVTGLKLTETHSTDSNGMPQNNIIVEYDNTNVENFLHCQIWMKTDADDSIWAQQGTASGVKYIIEGVQTGTTYIVKAVAVNKQGGTSAFADSPTAQITIKGSQLIPDAPKQFVLTWDERGALWEWLQDDNGYIDYFELRLDAKAGEWSDNLLDVTRNNFSRANTKTRSGTAYLFCRNVFGTYSQPATLIFAKPVAAKPNPPTLSPSLKGINITMDTLPAGYTGYKLLINDVEFTTTNCEYLYYQFSGKCTVKYCFVDVIGDGEYSDPVTVEIKTVLDLVEVPTIDRTKIDASIKNALEIADAQPGINENQNSINNTFSRNLSDLQSGLTDTNRALESNMDSVNNHFSDINKSIGDMQEIEQALRIGVDKNTASITTVAGNLKTFEEKARQKFEANTTVINQNSESITALAKRVTTTEDGIKTNTSAITQNADSITAVVKELNTTDPSKSNYSAISALFDMIELRVEKDGIISAINLSPELITIDGKFLHITGTTLIEKDVIVGANIASNSITTAHLQANAITADKIAADAIQVGGTNGNVTITPGALVVGGEDGNVTITPGSIRSDALAANSVIADKISAGAVNVSKLAAENFDLTGALSFTGGNVKLSGEGLRVTKSNGSSILYNGEGMNYIDSQGLQFACVGKMIIGQANHGQRVKFTNAWDEVPSVVVVPMELNTSAAGYAAADVQIVCGAKDVSASGFTVECYTRLAGSAQGSVVINHDLVNDGGYTLNIPDTATEATINIPWSGSAYGGGGCSGDIGRHGCHLSVTVTINGIVKHQETVLHISSSNIHEGETRSYNGTYLKTVVFTNNDTVSISVSADYVTAILDSAVYNASGVETVIATGNVAFIATDASNKFYSLANGD